MHKTTVGQNSRKPVTFAVYEGETHRRPTSEGNDWLGFESLPLRHFVRQPVGGPRFQVRPYAQECLTGSHVVSNPLGFEARAGAGRPTGLVRWFALFQLASQTQNTPAIPVLQDYGIDVEKKGKKYEIELDQLVPGDRESKRDTERHRQHDSRLPPEVEIGEIDIALLHDAHSQDAPSCREHDLRCLREIPVVPIAPGYCFRGVECRGGPDDGRERAEVQIKGDRRAAIRRIEDVDDVGSGFRDVDR